MGVATEGWVGKACVSIMPQRARIGPVSSEQVMPSPIPTCFGTFFADRSPGTSNAVPVGAECSESLSRKLACILRHKAAHLGLTVREEGYVPLQQLRYHLSCSRREIRHTVCESRHGDGAPRFEMCTIDGEHHIRALRRRSFAARTVSMPTQEDAASSCGGEQKQLPAEPLKQLKDLCKLRRDGLLTDKEFHQAKGWL